MSEEQLTCWLRSQQLVIDQIIADAAIAFKEKHSARYNFAYELQECQNEQYNLANGDDLCYDRPLVPLVYSLWYQGQRVNTFLRAFSRAFLTTDTKSITIFDLGAGTGAVQFAIGLIIHAMKNYGCKPPLVRIVNIDSSPFMLSYNKDYLWPAFTKQFPESKSILTEYRVNSWNTNFENYAVKPWLVASYLFDRSDDGLVMQKGFAEIVRRYRPRKVLLLTSTQRSKMELILSATKEIIKHEYVVEPVLSDLPLQGKLGRCTELRSRLKREFGLRGMDRPVQWEGSCYSVCLQDRNTQLDYDEVVLRPLSMYDLYVPKLKSLQTIQLSNEQQRAINFFGRQAIIIGPAGSGKSIVIAEKIFHLVDRKFNYNDKFKILFTSFNKELVRKVGDWLEQLLNPDRAKRSFYTSRGERIESSKFEFSSGVENVILMNFDLLPTRLGGLKSTNLKKEEGHFEIIAEIINDIRAEIGNSYDAILNPEFVFEEYHRIFYGSGIRDKQEYLATARDGRRHRLGKRQREIVYEVICRYLKKGVDSFITMRKKFYNRLSQEPPVVKFDYILVDEFQDCTRTDFEIFNRLVKDTNAMTLAGDLAQAIHIGKTANIPKDENTSRREYFYLEGSYRVPHRISECISRLSEEIVKRFSNNEAAKKIVAVKNSPPGARPIVVFGCSLSELIRKIEVIWSQYQIFGLTKVTVLEKDKPLCQGLKEKGIPSETDTILRLKGLEKDCVLWSTAIPVEDEREVHEFVYTIMTRTSNVLIIAISEQCQPTCRHVLGLLRQDRLIFFDEQTKTRFPEFCKVVETVSSNDMD